MATINQPRTEAFYEEVTGWPSEYTFIPDGMICVNNRFFSFKYGSIWEHNIDPSGVNAPNRCTFYGDDFDSTNATDSNSKPSYIEFIFNEDNGTIKNFKTMAYQGTGTWEARISTDQESTLDSTEVVENWSEAGSVATGDWVDKKGKAYAWIRGNNTTELDFRNFTISGIGKGTVDSVNSTVTFNNDIPLKLTVGDELYYFDNTGTAEAPVYGDVTRLAGAVTAISDNKRTVTFSSTRPGGGTIANTTIPSSNDFFVFSKDRITETSGIIGFFAIVRMTNTDNTTPAELFAVETEVTVDSNR